jgi:CheY-like chemotaxis protein
VNSTALVVSDDIILRGEARSMLNTARIACICAGTAAIDRAMASTKFDAVLLDIHSLSDITQAIHNVRQGKVNRYSILFALVADSQSASVAWGAGANFTIRRSTFFRDDLQKALQSARGLILREKRRYERHPVSVTVEFLHNGRIANGRIVDISERGACIDYLFPLPMHPVQLVFSLPGLNKRLRIEGLPAWARSGKVGVQFTSFADGSQALLSQWLARRTGT